MINKATPCLTSDEDSGDCSTPFDSILFIKFICSVRGDSVCLSLRAEELSVTFYQNFSIVRQMPAGRNAGAGFLSRNPPKQAESHGCCAIRWDGCPWPAPAPELSPARSFAADPIQANEQQNIFHGRYLPTPPDLYFRCYAPIHANMCRHLIHRSFYHLLTSPPPSAGRR
ncbi:hypothetical protein JXO59_00560 [candidate division KSB1 bacterium]|nr:hypothetical protein [candidate division KSB1 bacterium]